MYLIFIIRSSTQEHLGWFHLVSALHGCSTGEPRPLCFFSQSLHVQCIHPLVSPGHFRGLRTPLILRKQQLRELGLVPQKDVQEVMGKINMARPLWRKDYEMYPISFLWVPLAESQLSTSGLARQPALPMTSSSDPLTVNT